MSDQPTGRLLLNPKDERIRCRAGVQVELIDQIFDRCAGMPLVSVNLTRQPLTRTVLLAHFEHALSITKHERPQHQRRCLNAKDCSHS